MSRTSNNRNIDILTSTDKSIISKSGDATLRDLSEQILKDIENDYQKDYREDDKIDKFRDSLRNTFNKLKNSAVFINKAVQTDTSNTSSGTSSGTSNTQSNEINRLKDKLRVEQLEQRMELKRFQDKIDRQNDTMIKFKIKFNKDIFLIGDAFFTFPPTFAQGASQSIEVAFELYKNLQNDKNQFNNHPPIYKRLCSNFHFCLGI